jgi:hypothetical protein
MPGGCPLIRACLHKSEVAASQVGVPAGSGNTLKEVYGLVFSLSGSHVKHHW